MAKNVIIAEKQIGEKTVTRQFNPITWDLLGADKGGFVEVKQGKTPKEVAKKDESKPTE